MTRYLYNPELDVIGEAIALYAHDDVNTLDSSKDYSITIYSNDPVGYVVFADDGDGMFVNAELFEKTLKKGIVVEL